MVRSAASSVLAGLAGGALVAGLLAVVGADVVPGTAERAPVEEYQDVLVRELLMDRASLAAARDSVAAELAVATLWMDWIDERRTAPSHTLMEGIKNLLDPVEVALRARVVGELDRGRHWSMIPDPGLREGLSRYHALVGEFEGIGSGERFALRTQASTLLDRTEWSWMFEVDVPDPGFVMFRDNVRLFATPDVRTTIRLVAISLSERLEFLDRMQALNADLESRVREWQAGA